MSLTTQFGRQMKQWRKQRGLSQLELAVAANISQRHISFIETGRSRPREEVVLRVTEALEIPLRERNAMLEAAGLPPVFPEMALSDVALAPFRDAIQKVMDAQEPYPAFVIDRWWFIVDANQAALRMFPAAGNLPFDFITAFFGPGPYRMMIANYAAVAWTALRRFRTEVANAGPDERLRQRLALAEDLMRDVPMPEDDDTRNDLVVCPQLRVGSQLIKTVSMVARFGSAREVTLDELRVELMFPGDATAEAFFRSLAG